MSTSNAAVERAVAMNWTDRARCRNTPVEQWFTESGNPSAANTAVTVCVRCPVQPECLLYAVAVGERDGIWGGQSAKERGKLRKRLHSVGAVHNRRLCARCGMWFVVESLNSPAEYCDECAEEQTRQLDRLRERRAG